MNLNPNKVFKMRWPEREQSEDAVFQKRARKLSGKRKPSQNSTSQAIFCDNREYEDAELPRSAYRRNQAISWLKVKPKSGISIEILCGIRTKNCNSHTFDLRASISA